jgi:hypothetical protein
MRDFDRAAVAQVLDALDRRTISFEDLMVHLGGLVGIPSDASQVPAEVARAWYALDDTYAIAASQTLARPFLLEENSEVRAALEAFRFAVQLPPIH